MNVKYLWENEPAAFVGFAQAILALLLAFGVQLTVEQVAAILSVTSVGLGLLVRRKVTPV